jgi:hypothetical protein
MEEHRAKKLLDQVRDGICLLGARNSWISPHLAGF